MASRMETPPLEQRELLLIDGVQYESFNTSGGLGSLATTWDGKVRNLSYQSIRYPGHAAIMRTLLRDLGLCNRREVAPGHIRAFAASNKSGCRDHLHFRFRNARWSIGAGHLHKPAVWPRNRRSRIYRYSAVHRVERMRGSRSAGVRTHREALVSCDRKTLNSPTF